MNPGIGAFRSGNLARTVELPGVETCLKELDLGEDGWGLMIFFLSPSYTLEGKRPLDLLRERKFKPAIAAARRHDRQGAW